MKVNFKIPDRFYLLGVFVIIGTVLALIFNSLPDKESIAMAERGRVLGAMNQKIEIPLAIYVKDDDNEWRGISASTDINNILRDLGVPLYPEDLISAFPDPKLKIGTSINIERAPLIHLENGPIKSEERSWAKTVSDFLKEKNISLGPLDRISPSVGATLNNDDTIIITRIGERDEIVEEVIAYKKIEKPTTDMYKGERKIEQKGSDGKITKTFRLRYENNVLVSSAIINEEVIIEVKNEIILVGTKPRITVRCRFNDIVEEASAQYGIDPNSLCRTMMCESNGNPYSGYPNGRYQGLFQYDPGLWITLSARAGFAGAAITDARAQIFVTAWAWSHGYRSRWPNC